VKWQTAEVSISSAPLTKLHSGDPIRGWELTPFGHEKTSTWYRRTPDTFTRGQPVQTKEDDGLYSAAGDEAEHKANKEQPI